MKPVNLIGLFSILIGLLLIFGGVKNQSPVKVLKDVITTGKNSQAPKAPAQKGPPGGEKDTGPIQPPPGGASAPIQPNGITQVPRLT